MLLQSVTDSCKTFSYGTHATSTPELLMANKKMDGQYVQVYTY